jgi:photosystem II stability/assembly factor-like uncharacterized protein
VRALAVSALLLCAAVPASAQESLFVNVSPAFRPGPYSFIKVDPTDAQRFVVGTPEGWVLSTSDGGASTSEIQALLPRIYYPMVLRGTGGNRGNQFGRSMGRAAHRLFISMLHAGLTTTRWAPWMSMEDPSTEIFDIALPPAGGRGALAGPNGVFISDEKMGVWHRAMGFPRPKGNATIGFSVAFDPKDANVLFAGTSEGLWVSKNGGQSFSRHADKKMLDESIKQILWDTKDPNQVLLVAGETVYKSENHGESFEAVLQGEGEVNAIGVAEEGVYVASAKGLSLYGGEGTKQMIKDENVVGVVGVGNGTALAATEQALFIVDADGKRSVMNTTAADPFVKLAGGAELAWALTKYGIYRVGMKEGRAKRRAKKGPTLLMSLDEVQSATLKHLGVGDPSKSRLHDRWYAALVPMLIVEVKQQIAHNNGITFDATFPISYRYANASNEILCCGGYGTTEPQALAMVKWDLAKIIAGPYGNVTMPYGLVEAGLRNFRVKVLEEIRWRYRELRNLCSLLRYPPKDPKVRLQWQMRLEEYASYIDALTGKRVVGLENMEDPDEVED